MKKAIVFFLFLFIGFSAFTAINEQEEIEGESGNFEYLYLIQEGVEKLFEIDRISEISSGRIRVYIKFKDESSKQAFFAFYEDGKVTAEIQEKETGESEQVSVNFKKRCKCSETSYQAVDYDSNCPSDCNQGEEFYIETKTISPEQELGIGIDPDFLILVKRK